MNEKGYIVANQKYGNQIVCRHHTYTIGREKWVYHSYYNHSIHLYHDFVDSLVYSNFPIDFFCDYSQKSELPEDQVMPALEAELPPVPVISSDESVFRHYLASQNGSFLEKYHLYLLKEKPVDCQVTEKGILQFLDGEGKAIEIRMYTYVAGGKQWTYSTRIKDI